MIVPYGFDRADGQGGNPGTPDAAGGVQIGIPSGGDPVFFFEELADSPTIEIGEHVTVTHKFKCDSDTAFEILQDHPRGTIVTDSNGLEYEILSCLQQQDRGNHVTITMTMEGSGAAGDDPTGGFDPPPAEVSIEPVEFNPPIWYHPRYESVRRYNLNAMGSYTGPTSGGNPTSYSGYDLIRAIQSASLAAQHEYMEDSLAGINSTNVPDSTVLALCIELVTKLRKGESEFYLSGWRVQFTYYSWNPTFMCPGGFIQDPIYSGELPYWVWATSGLPDANPDFDNIFLESASINPDIYENGISWLRFADHREFSRVWWRTTETWVGGPLGAWDQDIYPVYVGRFDTGESDSQAYTAQI